MYTIKKRIEIAGSHRLDLPYDSPCKNLHGHNWVIEVEMIAGILTTQGMVTDFTNISKVVKQLDHASLSELRCKHCNKVVIESILPKGMNPTAENIAKWIFDNIKKNLDNPHAEVSKVTVQESEGNTAWFIP